MSQAAVVEPEKGWNPSPGPQSDFLQLNCFEALYGGAAGGGKSESLLIDALDGINERSYRALLLRRTYDELEESLIDRSHDLYPVLGGVYNSSKHFWRFPSGARIRFGHMEHEKDKLKYKSAEYQFIGFDEVTSFSEGQFRYMISRLRSSKGLRPRLRAGSNPGGEGHDWVLERYGPWLNRSPDYKGPRAAPGEVLFALTDPETGKDVWVPEGTPKARSRSFIGAKVEDNPHLDQDYIANLEALDPLTRRQLRDGDWMARAAPGVFFQRGWFKFVDSAPGTGRIVRFWDRAATEAVEASSGKPKNDPDWTVGLKMEISFDEPRKIYILDVKRFRATPGVVKREVRATAEMDRQQHPNGCGIRMGRDPGQAGLVEFADWLEMLMGFDFDGQPESGDKITRAKPISAQVNHGNVHLVRGDWNSAFVVECEAFPTKGVHDDQVDALSGAFSSLTINPVAALPETIVHERKSARGGR